MSETKGHDGLCPTGQNEDPNCWFCEHNAKVRAAERERYLKVQADERGELAEEYAIVHDGDPYMDGTHERRETGRFTTREAAERGFVVVSERSIRAPKANLRIERRLVGPWKVVE